MYLFLVIHFKHPLNRYSVNIVCSPKKQPKKILKLSKMDACKARNHCSRTSTQKYAKFDNVYDNKQLEEIFVAIKRSELGQGICDDIIIEIAYSACGEIVKCANNGDDYSWVRRCDADILILNDRKASYYKVFLQSDRKICNDCYDQQWKRNKIAPHSKEYAQT